MTNKTKHFVYSSLAMALLLLLSGEVLAQDPPSACVQQGAMAWDNWTKADAGGDGSLPTGEENKDYIRCKACHGWDVQGTQGGYVRRSRKETRPNAGNGDGDSTPRAIARGSVTTAMIAHDGTGRAFDDGTGSWVDLGMMGGSMHNSGNTADHAHGYTLGNQHPDFSGGELTSEQIGCLAEFLNYMDANHSAYFANIDPSQNPVMYTIVDGANALAGKAFYDSNCKGCHGDPATDHNGGNEGHPDGGILAFLAKDGKFSEFSHKARWGIPGTPMSYSSIGSPTSTNMVDMMLYLQELGGTGFAMSPGLSGHWWNGDARSGEGFLFDVSKNSAGEQIMIASFYTYDNMGNQIWIIGAGTVSGNEVVVDFEITDGATWGEGFDPDDVTRVAWGTGTFKFSSCAAGHIAVAPNAAMQSEGFTNLEYDINRSLLTPGVACPTPGN